MLDLKVARWSGRFHSVGHKRLDTPITAKQEENIQWLRNAADQVQLQIKDINDKLIKELVCSIFNENDTAPPPWDLIIYISLLYLISVN